MQFPPSHFSEETLEKTLLRILPYGQFVMFKLKSWLQNDHILFICLYHTYNNWQYIWKF